jgi:hypothetical protein
MNDKTTKLFLFLALMLLQHSAFYANKVFAKVSEKINYIALSQDSRYMRIGLDSFSQESVYLDIESIKKIKLNRFRYTLIVDLSRQFGSEHDFIVDCDNKEYRVSVVQRYYSKKRLFKTEYLGKDKKIKANTNRNGFPEYQANKVVCNGPSALEN